MDVVAGDVASEAVPAVGGSVDGKGDTTSLVKRTHLLVTLDSILDSLQAGKLVYALRSKMLISWLLERDVPFENSA